MNAAVAVPTRLIDVHPLADGRRVILRPVLPQDAELQQRLVRGLSTRSRTLRFFAPIRELPPPLLQRLTQVDHRTHVALIAETFRDDDDVALPVGEARYVVAADGATAEFALVVADGWQGLGIGRHLLDSLLDHARRAGLARMVGEVQADNPAMLALARRSGFDVRRHPDDARLLQVERVFDAAATAAAPSRPSVSAAA